MFEWYVVAAVVGGRGFFNVALTLLVAKSSSPPSRSTVIATVLTILSAVLTALVLLGVLGLNASYLEFLLQVALLIFSGCVVYSNPSSRRVKATLVASLGAIALLFFMIPLYGDALVAP